MPQVTLTLDDRRFATLLKQKDQWSKAGNKARELMKEYLDMIEDAERERDSLRLQQMRRKQEIKKRIQFKRNLVNQI